MTSKAWKEWEEKWLIDNYPEKGKKASSDFLNRPEASIRQKASRLKLKQNRNSEFFKDWQNRAANSKIGKKRPNQSEVIKKAHREGKLIKTNVQKYAISIRVKKWLSENPHPKGMLGKKHNPQNIQAFSKRAIDMWSNPVSKVNQDSHRQKLSDRMMKSQAGGLLRKGYSRGSQGKRSDLDGLFFRSSWEANYARYLNFLKSKGLIFKWEFEPDTFWFESIKRGVRSYMPDFKIWDLENSAPYYIEVKGWMDSKSKTKLKRMAKYYPDVRVDLFDAKSYSELKKKMSKIIKGWE